MEEGVAQRNEGTLQGTVILTIEASNLGALNIRIGLWAHYSTVIIRFFEIVLVII